MLTLCMLSVTIVANGIYSLAAQGDLSRLRHVLDIIFDWLLEHMIYIQVLMKSVLSSLLNFQFYFHITYLLQMLKKPSVYV